MKKFLSIVVMLILTMSAIQITAAAAIPETYLDGETLRIENFEIFLGRNLSKKIVEEKDGKIYYERYIYEDYSWDANGGVFSLYLKENGWTDTTDRKGSIYGGPVTLYTATYSKGSYRIQMDGDMYGDSFEITFFVASRPDDTVETTYEGYKYRPCGYGLWHTVENGVLTIGGIVGSHSYEDEYQVSTVNLSGAMYDYTSSDKTAPWYGEKTTKIILEKEVTDIGMGFGELPELTTIEIKGKLNKLQYTAFSGCDNLKEIYYAGTQEEWNNIAEDTKLPENVIIYCGDGTKIGKTEEEKEAEAILSQLRMTIGSNVAKLYGNDFVMDVAPQIINSRTMLPARYVTENLGGEIEWIGEHQIVAITKDSITLLFRIGSDSATLLATSLEYDGSLSAIVDEKSDRLIDIISDSDVINDNYVYDKNMVDDYCDYKFMTGDYYYGHCAISSAGVRIDSAPVIINERTFMPVRVIATFLGADVMWDGATQTVMIEPK